jgi:hypothetical protein
MEPPAANQKGSFDMDIAPETIEKAVAVLEAVAKGRSAQAEAAAEALAEMSRPAAERAVGAGEVMAAIRGVAPGRRMAGGGVRLAEIRKSLPGVGRGSLDAALLALQQDKRLVLYRFDNPALVTAEDEAATLWVAGAPRHYVFLK